MPDPSIGPYETPSQAILAIRQALALDPNSRGLRSGLAALYLRQGRHEEALVLLEALAKEGPLDDATGYLHASALLGTARAEEVMGLLHGHPKEGEWCLELGVEAGDLRRLGLSTRLFQRALACAPGNLEACHRLSLALDAEYRFQDSIRLLAKTLESGSDAEGIGARLRFHLAENLLRMGLFEPGFQLLESRFELEGGPRLEPMPLLSWMGGSPTGRHILIRSEQGFGDAFMLIRYATLLAEQGATVYLEPQTGARDVLATCDGVTRLIEGEVTVPVETVQAPIMSLPRLTGTRLETIPARIPYLRVPEVVPNRAAIDHCLSGGPGSRRVGLVWAGNPRHVRDRERSVPFEILEQLKDVPGITFVSLQIGPVGKPALPMLDLAPHISSFADTAYALQRMDGLISVDSSPAHLAGALGRPVWLALPWLPDWRWLIDRKDSPWYPTFELWRQPAPGDWASLFLAMAKRLGNSGLP
jgi:tetratricopeptide (TPR) repeat protein